MYNIGDTIVIVSNEEGYIFTKEGCIGTIVELSSEGSYIVEFDVQQYSYKGPKQNDNTHSYSNYGIVRGGKVLWRINERAMEIYSGSYTIKSPIERKIEVMWKRQKFVEKSHG
jgi:hypothetical protein